MNDTLDRKHLTDICRTFHPKATEYTFSSSGHGTFSRTDHTLGHKSALKKYKKIKIMPCIFSDHNTMTFEINDKKKYGKTTNTWRLKNILLKDEWVIKKLKRKLKSTRKPMKMITSQPLPSGHSKGSHKREVYSNPGLHKEERSRIQNVTLHLMELEEERQLNPPHKRKTGNKKD